MDWENERYVRVYTRDTVDWLSLSWEARALLMMILRKVDRSGCIELGRHGAKGLAVAVGMPADVVNRALAELQSDGCVEHNDGTLVVPNFLKAQEASKSDAQRQRESRERRRDEARRGGTSRDEGPSSRDHLVTNRDEPVTTGHGSTDSVTARHSVPNQPLPNQPKPAVPSVPPASADLDTDRFKVGTASCEEAIETFKKAVSAASGKPFALTSARYHASDLCTLMNAHAPRGDARTALSWLQQTVCTWTKSVEPKFAGGWAPSALAKWLNTGDSPALSKRADGNKQPTPDGAAWLASNQAEAV